MYNMPNDDDLFVYLICSHDQRHLQLLGAFIHRCFKKRKLHMENWLVNIIPLSIYKFYFCFLVPPPPPGFRGGGLFFGPFSGGAPPVGSTWLKPLFIPFPTNSNQPPRQRLRSAYRNSNQPQCGPWDAFPCLSNRTRMCVLRTICMCQSRLY